MRKYCLSYDSKISCVEMFAVCLLYKGKFFLLLLVSFENCKFLKKLTLD